ncbi:hypothetical protein [Peribacillus sp. SCS-37]
MILHTSAALLLNPARKNHPLLSADGRSVDFINAQHSIAFDKLI